MKSRVFLILVLAAAVVAVVLYARQSRRLTVNQSEVASLRREVERKSDELHELEVAKEHINRRRKEAEQESRALQATRQTNAGSTTATSSAATSSSANPGASSAQASGSEGFGKMMAKMMEDPTTRKFIRDQQRIVLDQLYAPLLKQLGLSAEDAEKFKELMADNTMRGAEKASSLFGGSTSTNRTETLAAIAAEQKDSQEGIRTLLGDDAYQHYQEYQKTAGERMQLNMFRQQTTGDAAINEQQTEQLLALINEEKQGLAASGQALPGPENPGQQLDTVFSEEKTEQLLQSQEALNQRVRDRAQGVLAPSQMDAFAKFQTNQMQMMRMGMTMARKMFGTQESPATTAKP